MSLQENGVSIAITGDNSALMLAMDASKAIARAVAGEIQKTLAGIKGPPVPDIGRVLSQAKQQVFTANAAMLSDTKQVTAKLKQELERQAADYRANAENQVRAARAAMVEERRIRHSGSRVSAPAGQFDHLQGTQFQGGTRGQGGGGGGRGGRGNAYGLAVGYNLVQDAAQGGLPAIANNIPEVMGIIANSPVLKAAGTVALPAVLGFLTFHAVKNWDRITYVIENKFKELTRSDEEESAIRGAQTQAKSRQRATKLGFDKAMASAGIRGQSEGEFQAGYGSNVIGVEERRINKLAAEAAEERKIQAELRAVRLQAIVDPAEKMQAVAEEKKRLLKEEIDAEKARAQQLLELAAKEQADARAALSKAQEELRALGVRARPEEAVRGRELEGVIPGLQNRMKEADSRANAARDGVDAARQAEAQGRSRQQIIQEQMLQDLSADWNDRMDRAKREVDDIQKWRTVRRDFERDLAATLQRSRENDLRRAKQKADLDESLEIAEAQAGGGTRKARRMERERDLRDSTEKYKAAGFTPEEAAARAQREQRVADRRENPRRIRGAGADGPAPERASALDYFDGKSMATPKTSALDDYKRRRGIDGVGSTVDKELARKDAEEAAAAKKSGGVAELPKLMEKAFGMLGELINAVKENSGKAPQVAPAGA